MSEESELLATLSSLLSDDETKEQTEAIKSEENSSPFDMDMILKLGSVFSELNTDDDRSKLLRDLKPFLSSDKHEHVEKAVRILKLLKIAQKAKNENLF